MKPLLTVNGLSIAFSAANSGARVVEDLSFAVYPGRTLAVVGESGSGKSVTALAILRLVDMGGATFPTGRILFEGTGGARDLLRADKRAMRAIRGKEIAMIFQEPMTSLDPVFTIGDQIAEVLTLHEGMTQTMALARAGELLDRVRLSGSPSGSLALLKRYPHQLSGGQRQRVMIAMALACRPRLLICDEPTTALDVTLQAQILQLIRELQQELDMAVIFITHDMGVVAEMADEVVVMRGGRKVEEGPVSRIFASPQHPYTRTLLSAVPKLGSMAGEVFPKRMPVMVLRDGAPQLDGVEHLQDTARYEAGPLLSVDGLSVRFPIKRNLFGKVTHRCHALSRVTLDLYPGETLALVGESGSGKSTLARAIQRLQTPFQGEIYFQGRPYGLRRDAQNPIGRTALCREVQYIFQDPFASLDPRKTIGFSIAEPIRTHALLVGAKAIGNRVAELLDRVGLDPGYARRYPHEFSGGQRQRVAIARALACGPKLIVADEALSALDVSIRAQIINLFMDLQKEHGLAYLFISHDMAVVEKMSHRVAVLYLGQIMELGSRRQVFETPAHPYTKRLLSAVPVADPAARTRRATLRHETFEDGMFEGGMFEGGRPHAVDPPTLCHHREIAPGHFVARND